MREFLFLGLISVSLFTLSACGASGANIADEDKDKVIPEPSSATYKITFTSAWNTQSFTVVPDNAHFSDLAGAIVNSQSELWAEDELASTGMERLAEDGAAATLNSEIAIEQSDDKAFSTFSLPRVDANESGSTEFVINEDFPLITFASMVAPSTDWFVGLSNFSLVDNNGEWIENTGAIKLPVYDAGTESGNTFSFSGTSTVPKERISLLSGVVNNGDGTSVEFSMGLVNENAIATIQFVKQ